MTPDQVLDDQNDRAVKPNTRERVYWSYLCVEFAKESVMPNNPASEWRGNKTLGFRAKSQARYAVCSWFAYNDLDLKKVKSERIEQTDIQPLPPITLQGFAKIVKLAPLKWACALVVLLQSAVRIGDFFDQLGLLWPTIKEQIDKKTCIIRINTRGMEINREVPWREMGTKLVCLRLYGATTRGATFDYMTFLGNDALDLLDRYVKERGDPAKGERLWDCDKTRLQKKIHVWAIKAGLMQREKDNTKGGRRYPWHCFIGNTIVSGDFLPIADLAVGQHQITTATGGNYVKQKFAREYEGELFQVKASGAIPLDVTPEHPLMVVSEVGYKQKKGPDGRYPLIRELSQPYWKPAKAVVPFNGPGAKCRHGLRGDYLILPRIEGTIDIAEINMLDFMNSRQKPWASGKNTTDAPKFIFPLNQETAWFLGLYVAEGSSGSWSSGPKLNLGPHEGQLALKASAIVQRNLGLKTNVRYEKRYPKSNDYTLVDMQSKVLGRALVEWCGRGASGKQIPDFVLYHKNSAICEAFIEGYLAGDGCFSFYGPKKNLPRITAYTTSLRLALQLQLLFARLGRYLKLSYVKPHSSEIQGRKIVGHGGYAMMCVLAQHNKLGFWVLDKQILLRVISVKPYNFHGMVYNIETNDGTYLAHNLVVHNCHRLRKLFKTNCVLRGVSEADSEAFEGRKPTGVDKVYDERHISHPEVFAAEYLKVEPYLNVLSNPEGKIAKATELFIKRFEQNKGPAASSNGRPTRHGKS